MDNYFTTVPLFSALRKLSIHRRHDAKSKLLPSHDLNSPLAFFLLYFHTAYLLQVTELSLDEMIVKFKGRSADTMKFNHKPIKKGHKVFAICWRGLHLGLAIQLSHETHHRSSSTKEGSANTHSDPED
jgi:hypothetical protein